MSGSKFFFVCFVYWNRFYCRIFMLFLLLLTQVLFGEDVYKIAKDLENTFPYSYSSIHYGTSPGDIPLEGLDTTPPCPAAVFMPFAGCLKTSCQGASQYEALAGCILSYCAVQFAALPQECWTCFSSTGPESSDILLGFVHFLTSYFNLPHTRPV